MGTGRGLRCLGSLSKEEPVNLGSMETEGEATLGQRPANAKLSPLNSEAGAAWKENGGGRALEHIGSNERPRMPLPGGPA